MDVFTLLSTRINKFTEFLTFIEIDLQIDT
jgi:hypothetical protein